MPRLKNLFTAGRMNKDADSRLVPNGEYRDALNIKVSTSEGDDAGVVETVLSNIARTSFTLGANPTTIGLYEDETNNIIYWWVTSDTDDYLLEYDVINDTSDVILEGDLGLNSDNLITGAALIPDSDNNRKFIAWTDDLNPIRLVNITEQKVDGPTVFTEESITLVKAPPLSPPTITLGNSVDEEENNILDRFLRFGYRYKYRDGEYSAISPLTEHAFLPKSFQFDYSTATNESMVNQFNNVTIEFDTGSSLVTDIELVFKESGTNEVYSIKSFNKSDESWANNSTQSYVFTNDTGYKALGEEQLLRLYDNVPLRAKALELIGDRLVVGNYVENIDIDTDVDLTTELVVDPITEGDPTETVKSVRNYEVGIVYMDNYGRRTTVLLGKNSSVYIPNKYCDDKVRLRVDVPHLAPTGAERYQFFIKQPRTDYDVIIPSIFYQDGVFTWIRLEADDQQKVEVGDFLYVKADATRVLPEVVRTRVLDIVEQDVNFLEDEAPSPFEELQKPGLYMKVKATEYNVNPDTLAIYENVTEGFRSSSQSNNYNNNVAYLESAVYYGAGGLNDLTESGTYTGTDDIRYEIQIFTVGATDTYRWRKITTSDGVVGAWDDNGGLGYNITGTAQTLDNGVQITFGATTGHSSADEWVVSAKSTDRVSDTFEGGTVGSLGRRALMHYKSKSSTDTNGEGIQAGAVITITYDDSRSDTQNVQDIFGRSVDTFISSASYANIEEWFWKENIIDSLTPNLAIGDVLFRRGTLSSNTEAVNIDPSKEMIMTFSSVANYTDENDNQVKTDSILEIRELQNNIIFETIPPNESAQPFYEIGKTYDINTSNGYHLASGLTGERNQGVSQSCQVILGFYNAFSWGNGFESYKIRDAFNTNTMKIDSRPLETVEDFRENKRVADMTWSQPYSQDVNYNGLNEFNLARANFFTKIDDRYGSIQHLYAEDTNLIVFSENKVHNVPFQKDILFDASGDGTLRESTNILGTPRAYAGEYGISLNPESFSRYGNVKYFSDVRRGCLLRLSLDGLTEISRYGMVDYYSDFFRDNPSTKVYGCYDLHDKEVLFYLPTKKPIAFKERTRGFTSRYSFEPDFMGSVANKFFTVKDGQLWEHYNENSATRANFYGTDYDATLKLLVNDAPSDVKIMKALQLEGNKAWDVNVISYLNDETTSITETDLSASDFVNREGKWDAHLRGNTLSGDLSARNAYGVGEVASVSTSTITFSNGLTGIKLRAGDNLYDSTNTLIGEIQSFDKAAGTITVDTTPTITAGTFLYGLSPARIDGGKIRGYNFEVDLTDQTNTRTELFAVNSEVVKSFPS